MPFMVLRGAGRGGWTSSGYTMGRSFSEEVMDEGDMGPPPGWCRALSTDVSTSLKGIGEVARVRRRAASGTMEACLGFA